MQVHVLLHFITTLTTPQNFYTSNPSSFLVSPDFCSRCYDWGREKNLAQRGITSGPFLLLAVRQYWALIPCPADIVGLARKFGPESVFSPGFLFVARGIDVVPRVPTPEASTDVPAKDLHRGEH